MLVDGSGVKFTVSVRRRVSIPEPDGIRVSRAVARLAKQQVTWRRFPVRLELYEESAKPQAPSHKLATIGEYKKL